MPERCAKYPAGSDSNTLITWPHVRDADRQHPIEFHIRRTNENASIAIDRSEMTVQSTRIHAPKNR